MYKFEVLFSLLFTTSICITRTLALNVLVAGPYRGNHSLLSRSMNLTARQYLYVSNFYLVMQPDRTLVAYDGSVPFLTTQSDAAPQGPSSTWDCYATMQADGNLVVYNATSTMAVWATGTYSFGYTNSTYRYLMLGRNGSLSMYEHDGTALIMNYSFIPVNASLAQAPSRSPASNLTYLFPPDLAWKPSIFLDNYPYMPAEYFLSQGSKLQTLDERFILVLGHDCKLQSQEIWTVNRTVKRVVWDPQRSKSSRAIGGNCQLVLQQDGLLEVRDNVSGVVYWNSSVSGNDTVNWVLKVNADNGDLSVSDILNSTNVIWTTAEAEFWKRKVASVWPIVVGVIGGVLFVAMVAVIFWYLYLRPRFSNLGEKEFRRRLQISGGKSKEFSQAKIKQATNNFANKIGDGGFGDVFYGKLTDGQEIAAKVLSVGSHQSNQEFYNEVELLSVVHHKYLVSLLGYSST